MKQYILAFITALLFSSFAIADTPKQLTEGEYADYIPLVSSPVAGEVESLYYFPPNIDELINILGKHDSFKITIPKNSNYSGKDEYDFYRTKIISNTKVDDSLELVVDSSRKFENYRKPTIFNEQFFVRYGQYTIKYFYSAGYIAQTSLKIKFDGNLKREEEKEFYGNKISELLIQKGFKRTESWSDFISLSDVQEYTKGDIIVNTYNDYSSFINRDNIGMITIVFSNSKVTEQAEKNIKDKYAVDISEREKELNRIFK